MMIMRTTTTYAKYIFLALTVLLVAISSSVAAAELCEGKSEVTTDLDFARSTVKKNDLEKPGGELRFGNIGKVRDQDVDLVVKATNYSNDYKGQKTLNGKKEGGAFGRINLRTKRGDPNSGSATFEFCFVQPNTNNRVTVDSFQWYVSHCIVLYRIVLYRIVSYCAVALYNYGIID